VDTVSGLVRDIETGLEQAHLLHDGYVGKVWSGAGVPRGHRPGLVVPRTSATTCSEEACMTLQRALRRARSVVAADTDLGLVNS